MLSINWILPALLTAFFTASQDAWVKRHFSMLSTYDMLAFPMAYSLPLFCVAAPFVEVPPIDGVFLAYFLLSIPVNGLGLMLHMRAIQISSLSLTLPYLAFTPVFIFFTGFVVLGEVPNGWGVFSVCIIVSGSYVLNIDPLIFSPLAPLEAFGREKGSKLMLLAALIYSFGAVAGKKAILHSSVMFFTIFFFIMLNICFIMAMVLFGKIKISVLRASPFNGIIAGGLLFLHAVCHGWAISITKAVYMIAVKRISILFGIVYGGLLFKEKHLLYRLIGAGLMIAGATLVTLKG
jgi:drug/metabolite transporter (DMT)-like permease